MAKEQVTIKDNKLREKLYKKDIKIWSKRESLYRQNKSSMFSIVLGQCSEAMKVKLESETDYKKISSKSDVIKLLKMIRNVAFAFESKRYPLLAVHTEIKGLYGNYQKSYMGCDSYMESFQNLVQVIEHCGGDFGNHPTLIKYNLKQKGITAPDSTKSKNALEESKEAYLAISFLCRLNKDKYQDLLDNLSNSYLAGQDEYPKTVVDTYNLVTNWKVNKRSIKH